MNLRKILEKTSLKKSSLIRVKSHEFYRSLLQRYFISFSSRKTFSLRLFYKSGARVDKYKLGARTSKYKSATRAGKYKLGARAEGQGQGRRPSNGPRAGKYKKPVRETSLKCSEAASGSVL